MKNKTTNRTWLGTLAFLFSLAALASCGVDPAVTPTEIETATGTLTQAACTTAPVSTTVGATGQSIPLGGVVDDACTTFQSVSVDATYSTSACGSYITELTGAGNLPQPGSPDVIVPTGSFWSSRIFLLMTPTTCEQSKLELFAYIHMTPPVGTPTWLDAGTGRKLKGLWVPIAGTPFGSCTFVSDVGDGQIPPIGYNPYRDRIRIVGKLTTNGIPQRVSVGVRQGVCSGRVSGANGALAAGRDYTCATLEGGAVKCWGQGGSSLGLGDTANRGDGPNEMGTSLPWVRFNGPGQSSASALFASSGGSAPCVLTGGLLKCWGDNSTGALGLGDTVNRGDGPNQMGTNLPAVNITTGGYALASIGAGDRHTCSIATNGQVKCWGLNIVGQLGQGDHTDRGDGPNEMGDSLLPVQLGSGITATRIFSNGWDNCALFSNGKIKCWGYHVDGNLGRGTGSPPTFVDGIGDDPNEMGDNLPFVQLGTGLTVTSVSMGIHFMCALFSNSKVKCWGLNQTGQLGLGDANNRGDQPNEMGDNLPFVDLGAGLTVTALSSGSAHTCALFSTGQIKCWGTSNDYGELGLGDHVPHGAGASQMGAWLPFVNVGSGLTATAVSAGHHHTCARLSDGRIKCWGSNNLGQLGLGDTVNRGKNLTEMGDNLPFVDLGPI